MNHFTARDGVLHAEDVSLAALAAAHGTPLYVYSAATMLRHVRVLQDAVAGGDVSICYAVKANPSLGILSLLARQGLGFDIVSGGELQRVLRAGGSAQKTVFAGVGKTRDELALALRSQIKMFNVESAAELHQLDAVAQSMGVRAPVAIRVNPEVDANTHPYIATGLRESKFGLPMRDARALYAAAKRLPGIEVIGVDCHIGSQITSLAPFSDALDRVLELVAELRADGHHLAVLDVGGGLGVPYRDETPPDPAAYGALVLGKVRGLGLETLLEPGRLLVANAGVLLTRVINVKKTKHRSFVVVDAAMNDLIRPALYEAHHGIEAVAPRAGTLSAVDVVGPVCESADCFAKDRPLPPLEADDLLCIRSAGAYGFSMSSQYNSRPRAAEVLVSGGQAQLIREREGFSDLVRGEHLCEL